MSEGARVARIVRMTEVLASLASVRVTDETL
jgi:hypothetical protein